MKVTLEKYGGLTAGIRQQPYSVESVTLSEPAKTELLRLVEAVKATPPVEMEKPTRLRDAMTYAISVDEDGSSTSFRQSDQRMSEAFSNLLSWLERHATETSS